MSHRPYPDAPTTAADWLVGLAVLLIVPACAAALMLTVLWLLAHLP